MIKLRRVILSYIFGGAVLFGTAAASFASAPPRGGKSIQGPFYNSATNSYFQLYKQIQRGKSYQWSAANTQARRHIYKGEQGRLAIVKDPKTLEFIRKKFSKQWKSFRSKNDEVWIGLRFFCKYRRLIWVDGDIQPPKAPGMWSSPWYRNPKINCNSGIGGNYMPIYLRATSDGSVFWQASGPKKVFRYYMVEFPAPKKSTDISQNLKETTDPAEAITTQ